MVGMTEMVLVELPVLREKESRCAIDPVPLDTCLGASFLS